MKLLGVEESFVAGTRKSIKFERKHDKVRGSSGNSYETSFFLPKANEILLKKYHDLTI